MQVKSSRTVTPGLVAGGLGPSTILSSATSSGSGLRCPSSSLLMPSSLPVSLPCPWPAASATPALAGRAWERGGLLCLRTQPGGSCLCMGLAAWPGQQRQTSCPPLMQVPRAAQGTDCNLLGGRPSMGRGDARLDMPVQQLPVGGEPRSR